MNIEDAISRVDAVINRGDLAKDELVRLSSHAIFSNPKDSGAFSPKLSKEYVIMEHDVVYDVVKKLQRLASTPAPVPDKYGTLKELFKNKNYAKYSAFGGGLSALALGSVGMGLDNMPLALSGVAVAFLGVGSFLYYNKRSQNSEFRNDIVDYKGDSQYYIYLTDCFNKYNIKSFAEKIDSYIINLDNFIQKFVPDTHYDRFENIVNNYIEIGLFRKDMNKIVSAIQKNTYNQESKSVILPLKRIFGSKTFIPTDVY